MVSPCGVMTKIFLYYNFFRSNVPWIAEAWQEIGVAGLGCFGAADRKPSFELYVKLNAS